MTIKTNKLPHSSDPEEIEKRWFDAGQAAELVMTPAEYAEHMLAVEAYGETIGVPR